MILELKFSKRDLVRLERQAKRHGETPEQYALNWLKCAVDSDEDDDPSLNVISLRRKETAL